MHGKYFMEKYHLEICLLYILYSGRKAIKIFNSKILIYKAGIFKILCIYFATWFYQNSTVYLIVREVTL